MINDDREFRVGDKVSDFAGTVSVVTDVDCIGDIKLDGRDWWYDYGKFKLVEDTEEVSLMTPETGDTWQFTVTSEDAIQFCAVCKELSYAEPLAFITYDDREFVVIHESLSNKANKCKGMKKIALMHEDQVLNYTPCDDGTVLELKDIKSRKAIKAWAKAVKKASWKRKYRGRGLVTVTKVAV